MGAMTKLYMSVGKLQPSHIVRTVIVMQCRPTFHAPPLYNKIVECENAGGSTARTSDYDQRSVGHDSRFISLWIYFYSLDAFVISRSSGPPLRDAPSFRQKSIRFLELVISAAPYCIRQCISPARTRAQLFAMPTTDGGACVVMVWNCFTRIQFRLSTMLCTSSSLSNIYIYNFVNGNHNSGI